MNRFKILLLLLFFAIAVNLAIFVSNPDPGSQDSFSDDPLVISEEEPILNFHTEIRVTNEDKVVFAEQIEVKGAGKAFRRGIMRPLPLKVRGSQGQFIYPNYEFISVSRNGQQIAIAEPKKTDRAINFYLGESDKYLDPGVYSYFFQYSATGLIESQPQIKRLAFDLTGASTFPILSSSAQIRLPEALNKENVVMNGYVIQPFLSSEGTQVRSEEEITKDFQIDDGSFDIGSKGKPVLKITCKRRLNPGERFIVEISWAA